MVGTIMRRVLPPPVIMIGNHVVMVGCNAGGHELLLLALELHIVPTECAESSQDLH